MSFVRSLVDDLVAKRLWPVALALLVTAIAVPVVLGRSGADAGGAPVVAPASAPADGVAGSGPAVEIVGPASVRSRAGHLRDPFRRKAKAAAQVATADGAPATATTPAATSGGGTKAPASPSTDTSSTTTPAAPVAQGGAAPEPAPAASAAVYRTRVSWGTDSGVPVRGLSRLEPLGGTSNPALLYLGTTEAHDKALFLLGPDALADGEPACTETSCRIIELKAGQSVAIGVVGKDGAADRRYELKVAAIAEQAVADQAEALALRGRVHADGRDVLRAMVKDTKTALAIGQFTYDRSLGAVVTVGAP
jgi:hypothetical protein